MAMRRVSIAALPLAVGVVLATPPSARADGPPPEAAPAATIVDSATPSDGANEAPGQDAAVGGADDAYADTDPSALTDFRGALDPHGTWLDDPTYGTVWTPNPDETGEGFTPYASAGHWAYDGDYVWVSDYAWGWVAFHYGRWEWIPGRGWAWIPGRLYAPAWVVWRIGVDDYAYVGWAPMPPAWAWQGGEAVGAPFAFQVPFVYCPQGDVFAPAIATRIVTGEPAASIAPHTRPYVHAKPFVLGQPFVQPILRGPSIAALGIDPSRVVRLNASDRGLARAQLYARPSAAYAVGVHQPVPHLVRPRPMVTPPYVARPTIRAPRRR